MRSATAALVVVLASLLASLFAIAPARAVDEASVREAIGILGRAVAFRTAAGEGRVPEFAAWIAQRLREGGYADDDIEIIPVGETAMLIARYPGSAGGAPILLSAHMDVVPARREDWSRDPFTMVEENGFLYGRGVYDNKFGLAMILTTLLRLKAEGFVPAQDLVLVLSGDEETDMVTTRMLAARFRGVARMVLNSDAGGGTLAADGTPIAYNIQAAEKTYADFEIRITNPGGHSSRPRPDNAIVDLAEAVRRLAAWEFPIEQNELTREFFRVSAAGTPGALGEAMRRFSEDPTDRVAAAVIAADPEYVGQLRTTCVPTMVSGGHARNALPQAVRLNVNCRIFPGTSVAEVRATLAQAMALPQSAITVLEDPVESDASPLSTELMSAVRAAVDRLHPGLAIVPQMSVGGTDSMHFRNAGIPSYGVAGIYMDPAEDYSHGLDERVPVAAISGALDHWHELIVRLAR